jgi:hypothetical protein
MTYTSTSPMSPANPRRAADGLRMTPGRWVLIALTVPVALALIGWTGFTLIGLFAHGSYPFSYAAPVDNGQVSVNISAGNVTLRQAPGTSARLTGTVQYGLIRPDISEGTSSSGINVDLNCDGVASNCGADATLSVPARTAVTLNSGGGDISVSGFTSPMTLSADGGNMTASNLTGNLRLDTGGGDLTGSGLTGNVQISTEGGNVSASNLGNSSATLRLDTGGGDITGNGLSGQVQQLLTEGGNINLNFLASPQFNADSGGGDVTVNFTQTPVNVQITTDGGNVTVILPPGDTKYDILTPATDGGNLNIQTSLVNSASPNTITVNSGGGDITITQAS